MITHISSRGHNEIYLCFPGEHFLYIVSYIRLITVPYRFTGKPRVALLVSTGRHKKPINLKPTKFGTLPTVSSCVDKGQSRSIYYRSTSTRHTLVERLSEADLSLLVELSMADSLEEYCPSCNSCMQIYNVNGIENNETIKICDNIACHESHNRGVLGNSTQRRIGAGRRMHNAFEPQIRNNEVLVPDSGGPYLQDLQSYSAVIESAALAGESRPGIKKRKITAFPESQDQAKGLGRYTDLRPPAMTTDFQVEIRLRSATTGS